MILSAEKLAAYELCPRRYIWTDNYSTRISPLRALYIALDAGLRTEKDPEHVAENELLSLAAAPGLDIVGGNVYGVAMHHAKLAGVLTAALRSAWSKPWTPIDSVPLADGNEWRSGAYDAGDGQVRRIALVDRWSDDRKQQEISGWRTIGEACALDRPILITAIDIGAAREKRRYSPWTRCYRHPRNRVYRMKRRNSEEDFSKTWAPVWREDSGIKTADWLTQMRSDGCITDLVHTVEVPVPRGRLAYMEEIKRLADELESLPKVPAMRMAGCHGFAPCPFLGVCPETNPEKFGFRVK